MDLSKVDEYLEKLDHTHIVLFHEGGKEKRETEYGFIEKGLEKNQHCFYTTQNPQQVLDEMREVGMEVDTKSNRLLMVKIPEEFETFSKMILDEVATLTPKLSLIPIS